MTTPTFHPLVAAALEGEQLAVGKRGAQRGRPEGTTYAAQAQTEDAAAFRQRMLDAGVPERELLHNDEAAAPAVEVQREKVIHRVAIYMHCEGKSNREIAQALDYTETQISHILRQPWARARITQILSDAGKDLVTEALRASALDSVQTLLEIRDDPDEKGSVRVAAANSLLDRFLGKPTQRVEVAKGAPNPAEINQIDAELDRLRAQQRELATESYALPA